jgi:hypothetical protein
MFVAKPYFLALSDQIAILAIKVLKNVLRQQGHNLTGKLLDSIEAKTEIDRSNFIAKIQIYFENYGNVLNTGIKPNRVPYERGSGKKTSKVVQSLSNYARLRGMANDNKQALKIAFAILNSWKKNGAPTIGSKKFSKTGRRTGSIQETIEQIEPLINDIINKTIVNFFELYFEFQAAQIKR